MFSAPAPFLTQKGFHCFLQSPKYGLLLPQYWLKSCPMTGTMLIIEIRHRFNHN